MDPYQPCPCGSGKNFKWCCQPYFSTVEKARQQHNEGQHETALRTIHQLVEKYPGSAPVLGFEGELLYMNGRPAEADESLQKAFAINPNFPFGHWLRGIIRKDEGEIVGALIQFRKAAELYDPKANEILAEIHTAIFDIEMRLNRPVAARAALERAIHFNSSELELRKAFDQLFGKESRLPECSRRAYQFRPADPKRAAAWSAVLPAEPEIRFGDAATAFERLTSEEPSDAAAWFNLGLVRAWVGNPEAAVEALSRSMELETDELKAAETGALMEVLRCGEGMEGQSDYVEHRVYFQLQQPQPFVALLEEWSRASRLAGVQQDQESGTLSALILEQTTQFGIGIGAPVAKLASYMFLIGNIIRLWHPNKDSVAKVADEIAGKLSGAATPPTHESGFCNFSDVAVEAMVFPTREAKAEELQPKIRESAESFFEEIWIHRPLKSLAGVSPIDAAGHPTFRKRLLGVVRFTEDCYISTGPRVGGALVYDFGRVRRKLGLAAPSEGAQAAAASGGEPKIDELSVAELAGLDGAQLTPEQLDQAFRAALKLDARDLAGKFARAIIALPIGSAAPDRYPYFNHLIQLAQAENDASTVMSLLDEGQKADADLNEGRRQGDFTLRRAQLHAKNGDIQNAYDVLKGLLAAHASELKFYGPAIETMLSKKKGTWALEFAEAGLAQARKKNNRDSEQYFMELAEAARKQGGG